MIGLDSALNEWQAAIPPERTHSLTLRSCFRLLNIAIFYFQLGGTPQIRQMIRGLAYTCTYAIIIYKYSSTDLSFQRLRSIVVSQHFYQRQAQKLTKFDRNLIHIFGYLYQRGTLNSTHRCASCCSSNVSAANLDCTGPFPPIHISQFQMTDHNYPSLLRLHLPLCSS